MPIRLLQSRRRSWTREKTLHYAEVENIREELVLEYYGIDEESVNLKPKNWIRRGDAEYLLIVHFHYGKKEWGIDGSIKRYDELEFKGTKYERPGEYAYNECFSKTLQGTIDCIEQKFDVKVKIINITPEELARRERLVYEEAISPKVYPITLLDLIVSNSEKIIEDMKTRLPVFCERAKVGEAGGPEGKEFAEESCTDAFGRMIYDLEISIQNENWDHYFKEGKLKSEFNKLLQRVFEGGTYWCEKAWGVEEQQDPATLTEGERIGAKLFDALITRPKMEFIATLGDIDTVRREEIKCEDALKGFLSTYMSNLKEKIEQLR